MEKQRLQHMKEGEKKEKKNLELFDYDHNNNKKYRISEIQVI